MDKWLISGNIFDANFRWFTHNIWIQFQSPRFSHHQRKLLILCKIWRQEVIQAKDENERN